MLKKIYLIIFMLAFMGIAFAWSPELKNKDSKRYDLKIKCNGTTTSTFIGSITSTTLNSSDGCILEVIGVGSIKLKNDKTYIIKNGTITEN